MDEFGFEFPFADAGFCVAEDAAEAISGDAAGDFRETDFLRRLDGAELVEKRCEAGVVVEGEACFTVFDEAVVTRLDASCGAWVLVGGEVEGFRLEGESGECDVVGGEPFDALDAGAFRGLLFGELRTFPDGDGFVGLAEEEDFPVLEVVGAGEEDEDAFFLGDAGEIEEVAVLFEGQGGVGVGGENIVGMDDGKRSFG